MDDTAKNLNFVALLETYQCLYDIRHDSYTRLDIKDKAWMGISKGMNLIMWIPLLVDGNNYLIRYHDGPNFTIFLTDFKIIWYEELSGADLIERFKELNPLIDADPDEIFCKIKEVINSETTIVTPESDINLKLELKCKFPKYIIRCSFQFSVGDQDMYFKEFTLPLMQSVQYLEMRQKKLFDLLEKKDKEIQEHELEGGEITRKSLVTNKFNRTTVNENIPEMLFLNVFGKSRPFYGAFTKQFGIISLKHKVKQEDGEEKVKKKLKVEPKPL